MNEKTQRMTQLPAGTARVHYGVGVGTVSTLCKAPPLLVLKTSMVPDDVDCPGCLWLLLQSMIGQVDRCAERLRVVTNELINRAEYRIGPPEQV